MPSAPAVASASFDLGAVIVTVALDAGPRILGYARVGGPQLFAALPDEVIAHPTVGQYHFLGGHRLWRAPEIPEVTYVPDDHGVSVSPRDSGFELAGPPDRDGLTKRITVTQLASTTVVDHGLRNEGRSAVITALWAITQMVPGGTAILPQHTGLADPDGVGPNRHVVLWPYADPADPEVEMGRDHIRVDASHRSSRFKVGWPNRRGWLAYELGGDLFVKWAARHDDLLSYADLGASCECYRDERFLELETLGPLATIEPGEESVHREVWQLIDLEGGSIADVVASLPAEPDEMSA